MATIAVGTTNISGGTSGQCIFNNGSVAGTTPCGSNYPASAYVSSKWYNPVGAGSVTGVAVAAGRVYCAFSGVSTAVTIKALTSWMTTTAAGSGQLAIYSYSGGTLTYVNSIDSTTNPASNAPLSAALHGATTTNLVPQTLYAFCSNNSVAPTFAGVSQLASWTGGAATPAALMAPTAPINGYYFTSAYGCTTGCTNGFPTTISFAAMTESTTTGTVPLVAFQVN